MEACRLILVLIYAAKSLGMNTLTKSASCSPRITAVPLDQPDHKFYPYFMELLRCSGSWGSTSPKIYECVANETRDVNVTRFNTGTLKLETLTLRGKDGNHTSCKTACTIKPEQCPKPNFYDPESCACNCNHHVAPAGYECPAKKSWSRRTCSCRCTNTEMCPRRTTWSKEMCQCVCKPKRRQSCTFKRGVFDEKTCKCRFYAGQSSQGWNNNNGKFIGSRAFWCYTLIGEFLVMLVVFDMILFYKKSGMLYNLTRKCRSVKDNENQSTEAIGDGEESCKTAFSSLQSINVVMNQHTEQEHPTSNEPRPINNIC